MATQLTITVADKVAEQLKQMKEQYGYTNYSEFVEEIIREGINHYQKNNEAKNDESVLESNNPRSLD